MFLMFKHKVKGYSFWATSGEPFDTYAAIYVKNIRMTTDGKMIFDESMLNFNGYFASSDMAYNKIVETNKDKYDYVDITDLNK